MSPIDSTPVTLSPGDEFDFHDRGRVRVLRSAEPGKDLFGRDEWRIFCAGISGEAEGKTGYVLLGLSVDMSTDYWALSRGPEQ